MNQQYSTSKCSRHTQHAMQPTTDCKKPKIGGCDGTARRPPPQVDGVYSRQHHTFTSPRNNSNNHVVGVDLPTNMSPLDI
jgi:hypothetical protein